MLSSGFVQSLQAIWPPFAAALSGFASFFLRTREVAHTTTRCSLLHSLYSIRNLTYLLCRDRRNQIEGGKPKGARRGLRRARRPAHTANILTRRVQNSPHTMQKPCCIARHFAPPASRENQRKTLAAQRVPKALTAGPFILRYLHSHFPSPTNFETTLR